MKSENKEIKENKTPLFRTINYILMAVGLVLLLLGYILLRGGMVEDPNTFNGEIFNTRRLTISPILMFLGIVVEGVAIMWHPRRKESEPEA
ncbi:MAG: DUF3098 domain-containing protein [Bacteroidales bacterium]|nr:DUF3098 domain-containing protein [Bacteroidales bacterium]